MWTRQYFILVLVFRAVRSETKDPLVVTGVGVIKGLRADDGDYAMFLGIPFAEVNVSNPFGVARPHPGFEDTFEAYDDSTVCPQREEYNRTLVGSLECLNLNIFVPDTARSGNRLPVLVYLYGGAFLNGFYNRYLYGAKFLVKHDVILVSINFRGGPYGFMCLDTPEIPGNQGLKDQILALRWIKRHIGAFGGDETKITVGGHSAGSTAIHLHLQSKSEQLFDRAITISGTALIPIFEEPIKTAPLMLADHLGLSTDNIDEAIQYLAKVDTRLVITAAENLNIIKNFRPCVEKEFKGVENFITENWFVTGIPKVKDIPILMGISFDESCLFYIFDNDEDYDNAFKKSVSTCFNIRNDSEGVTAAIHHFYFGDEPVTAAVRQGVVDFDSDIYQLYPLYKTIEKYLDHEVGNIFLHVFSYVGKRNYASLMWKEPKCFQAQHGDDIGYLFDISYMKHWPVTPEDQQMIDRMTTIWTNFVKFGNPTPRTSGLLPVEWTPITTYSQIPYLNINTHLTVGSRFHHQRAAFWDLFYRSNKHLQIAYPNSNVYSAKDRLRESIHPKIDL